MKKQILFLFLIVSSFSSLLSQSSLFRGGYGHFTTGPGWFEANELTDYLMKPNVLGPSMNWKDLGIGVGGEGFAEIRGLLVGGGGYGLILPSMRADSGTAWIGLGAGYFKAGYAVLQNGRQFLAIMGGFGAGGIGVDIRNNSKTTDINFDPDYPIAPRDEKAYGVGYAMFDFGLSYKVVSSNLNAEQRGRYSGFMLGIDAGSLFGARMDEWRYDGEATSKIDAPGNFFSPYIRITLGGGSFKRPALQESGN